MSGVLHATRNRVIMESSNTVTYATAKTSVLFKFCTNTLNARLPPHFFHIPLLSPHLSPPPFSPRFSSFPCRPPPSPARRRISAIGCITLSQLKDFVYRATEQRGAPGCTGCTLGERVDALGFAVIVFEMFKNSVSNRQSDPTSKNGLQEYFDDLFKKQTGTGLTTKRDDKYVHYVPPATFYHYIPYDQFHILHGARPFLDPLYYHTDYSSNTDCCSRYVLFQLTFDDAGQPSVTDCKEYPAGSGVPCGGDMRAMCQVRVNGLHTLL